MSLTVLTPIYLNSSLLQDLTSILIGGYFNSKSSRHSHDNVITARLQALHRRQNAEDAKTSPVPINSRPWLNNPNASNTTNDIHSSTPSNLNLTVTYDEAILNYDEFLKFLEIRNSNFCETNVINNFSLFSFNNIIIDTLQNLCIMKTIDVNTTNIDNIHPGDYVKFIGILSLDTVSNYLGNLISILTSYDTTFLDANFDNTNIGPLTYTIILKLLTTIQNNLARGNTSDAIVEINQFHGILALISTYISQTGYIYDSNESPCVVFGKVTNIVLEPYENISLLRKTGLSEYYSNLLNSFKPYLQILDNNGFLVPKEPILNIPGPALQITPISICI